MVLMHFSSMTKILCRDGREEQQAEVVENKMSIVYSIILDAFQWLVRIATDSAGVIILCKERENSLLHNTAL